MSAQRRFDAIIVGAGHKSPTAAACFSGAGLRRLALDEESAMPGMTAARTGAQCSFLTPAPTFQDAEYWYYTARRGDIREDLRVDGVLASNADGTRTTPGRRILTSLDPERVLRLTGGNIFHRDLSMDPLSFMRPLPGRSQDATPLHGLYLLGAGAQPGEL